MTWPQPELTEKSLGQWPSTPPVLLLLIDPDCLWPTPDLLQAILQAATGCDPQALVQIVRSASPLPGTQLLLLGKWICFPCTVFRALTEVFCSEASSHV